MHRVSGSQIFASDGKWVAYAGVHAGHGVEPRRQQYLDHPHGGRRRHSGDPGRPRHFSPAWSPDGKMLAFLFRARDRKFPGFSALDGGGEAKKVTQLSTGADLFKWAPDGRASPSGRHDLSFWGLVGSPRPLGPACRCRRLRCGRASIDHRLPEPTIAPSTGDMKPGPGQRRHRLRPHLVH